MQGSVQDGFGLERICEKVSRPSKVQLLNRCFLPRVQSALTRGRVCLLRLDSISRLLFPNQIVMV